MGHIRLGRLPKTRRWREVVDLLAESPALTGAITASATAAADSRLRALSNDEAVNYAFWLLARVAWASHGDDFHQELESLGLFSGPNTSILPFISELSDRVRIRNANDVASGHFAEIASLALRRALLETVATQNSSFFGSTLEDLQAGFSRYSTRVGFADIAHRFFSDFFARTLRAAVDRELANHIGEDKALANVAAGEEFLTALDTYSRQASWIMHDFAEGWYSKYIWESLGQISPEQSRNFVGYAVRKLRMELKQGIAQA